MGFLATSSCVAETSVKKWDSEIDGEGILRVGHNPLVLSPGDNNRRTGHQPGCAAEETMGRGGRNNRPGLDNIVLGMNDRRDLIE